MSRTEKDRIIFKPPVFSEFKPLGISMKSLSQTQLSIDEYEALRLADFIGLSHVEASEEMGISRPTFTRLIEKTRRKIADFIIKGKLLTIEGGNIHFRNNIIKCDNCGHMFTINIKNSITKCPKCDSGNLQNLAGGFGHGKCCINNHIIKRGHHAKKDENINDS